MKRVFAKHAHDPANGVFGDCLRACIASLLDLEADSVPHFMYDGCSGEVGWARVNSFLAPRGLALMWIEVAPGGELGVEAYHMLAGLNGYGDQHVVIAHSMEPVHNPDTATNDFMAPETWLKPYDDSGTFHVGILVATSKRTSPFAQFALPKPEAANVVV